MAEVKIILGKDEINEQDELLKFIKGLKKNEKLKLKGFLQGMAFSKDYKKEESK